ncbi:MAG: glycosyltransferase [Oscillospiraceae bacterium]|nr:glycosyltransferase [Oscillospiraceae bacterium]
MSQKDDMKWIRRNLELMNKLKTSFSELPPYDKPGMLQRMGKKHTEWYVQPFGTAQNSYNAAAVEVMNVLVDQMTEMQAQVAQLTKQTVRELTTLKQEHRQSLSLSRAEQEAALEQLTAELDSTLSAASPESRTQAGTEPLTELPALGTEALFREFHAVQKAEDSAASEAALSALETQYDRALQELLSRQVGAERARPIAVLCRSYGSAAGMEAIRNEAYDLFQLLRHASRYPAVLVSVEPAGGQVTQAGDICKVPENRLGEWVTRNEPALLVICESTPELLTAGNNCLLLRNAIVRLSGQNPAQGLGGSRMQELLHLNDYGLHRYYTASAQAADTLESHGFRRPRVMYPYIDPSRPVLHRAPRAFDPQRFTVGFASSPMEVQQAESRGIPALCEAVRMNPDMRFIVLWRDETNVHVPEVLKTAANCELRTGKCDMAAFYSEIDCVLIPYADADYNHACPLSALEAMQLGIPAAASPASGISELIASCGMGVTADGTDAAALTAALKTVRAQYPAFSAAWRQNRLHALTAAAGFVHEAEEIIAAAIPEPVHTLYEWNRQLKLEKRHLVKGAAALKAYYQRQEVADGYAEERFSVYPQNCFDIMERGSVRGLLRHFFGSRNDLTLLDIASGTGRILGELLPFGKCSAYDASPAMLRALRRRFPDAEIMLRESDLLSGGILGKFDVITVFRFLRHYEYGTRKKLWALLRNALREGGVLLFDVPNRNFELPHRARNGWGNYPIYDIFWTKETLREELAANGLRLTALVPVGQGLYPLPAEYRSEPMTWTACVQKD